MQNQLDQNPTPGDEWDACPAGALQSTARRLQAQERRQQLLGTLGKAGGSAMAAAVLVLGIGMLLPAGEPDLGGLTCLQCNRHFDAYQVHLTDSDPMDPLLADQMQRHLANCDKCHRGFEDKFPGVLGYMIPPPPWVLAMIH